MSTHMSEEQEKFMAKTRAARARCADYAAEADTLNLPVLAREWDYLGKQLEGAVANQARAFRVDALAPKESEAQS